MTFDLSGGIFGDLRFGLLAARAFRMSRYVFGDSGDVSQPRSFGVKAAVSYKYALLCPLPRLSRVVYSASERFREQTILQVVFAV